MRWGFSILIILFGIITFDTESLKWGLLGLLLYSTPLLFQFLQNKNIHIYAIWFGVFLVIQSILSPVLMQSDFKTLPPNMHQIINIKAGVPGISGKQTITTDSKGFRTTKKIDYQNKADFRIFAIGGSTTEQLFLDDKATWTHLLQENLSKITGMNVEVINTGVSGLRAIHHLATLRKISTMHPDLAIFLVGINDWNRQIKLAFSKETDLKTPGITRQQLVFRKTLLGKTLDRAFKYSMGLIKEPEIIDEMGDYFVRGSLERATVVSFTPDTVSQEYAETLSTISDECKKYKLKCMFITQPTGYHHGATEKFKKDFWMTPPNQNYSVDFDSMVRLAALYNAYLIKFSKENNHYICDPASRLVPTVENFQDDCHFTTSGARNMSAIINACVLDIIQENQRQR